jgi:hypothetical protein
MDDVEDLHHRVRRIEEEVKNHHQDLEGLVFSPKKSPVDPKSFF